MSKTPTKTESTINFIPREITTPLRDNHGISKTVYSHVSNVRGLLLEWLKMRDKGVRLCRAISALKLHECNDDYYPSQLKPLMDSLLEALESLKNIVDGVQIIHLQMQALAKLQSTEEPVISTWSAKRISKHVTDIYEALQDEYRLKHVITENVAHCRDEYLIEMYISGWELEAYFDAESSSYLFVEVGLTGIT